MDDDDAFGGFEEPVDGGVTTAVLCVDHATEMYNVRKPQRQSIGSALAVASANYTEFQITRKGICKMYVHHVIFRRAVVNLIHRSLEKMMSIPLASRI